MVGEAVETLSCEQHCDRLEWSEFGGETRDTWLELGGDTWTVSWLGQVW